MKAIVWFILCFIFVHNVQNIDILSLDTFKWKLTNRNKNIEEQVNIPGGIYSDLNNKGILNESLYYRFNDVAYRWIAKENWTYSVKFSINEQDLNNKNKELIFHGLDGHATIYLNQHKIGKAINSYVRYRFDVSELIVQENYLEIKFESPIESANRLFKNAKHPVPPNCVPNEYNGECHINFLRRMPASFGWDWGPAVPSVGIWKSAELVYFQNDVIIRDITVSMISESSTWKLLVKVFLDVPLRILESIKGQIFLTLFVKNNKTITSSEQINISPNTKFHEVAITSNILVAKNLVELWWPNGYGSQNLYQLSATFKNEINENNKSILIGFRTVELIQKAVNESNLEHGLTFYLSVNGVPIFAKGSNYIPSNILPEKSYNTNTLQYLIETAKISHMNILRIWGGGRYESDEFYELCDRNGILIWQDMMFACSMYPVDVEFLSSVTNEINQQVRRLQFHPCIALWAGNNENEAALRGNWYNTRSQFMLFKKEYIQLYVDTIKNTLLAIDTTRSFLISSPTNGLKSEKEGYVSKNPYDDLYGDVHFYNYYRNSFMTDVYPLPRFCSEYGFQSLPSLSSLQKVATEEDLSSLNTEFMKHRQHLPLGYIYLVYMMFLQFSVPPITDLNSIIYISQIHQAMSVKLQTEWYRKWRSTLLPNGKGMTMGAMYWQLNDVWDAPSWSSIEFNGKWKMLQYYAVNFFSPVIITADMNLNKTITVNVISDLTNNIVDAELRIEIYKWDSMIPVDTISKILTIEKESGQTVISTSVDELIESKPECKSSEFHNGEKCFLRLTLNESNTNLKYENFLYPVSFKRIKGLQNCSIKATVESCSNSRQCIIDIKVDTICLFIWLDVGDIPGYFSENGFTMTYPSKKILFNSRENITTTKLEKFLTVTVLDKKRLDSFTLMTIDTKQDSSMFEFSFKILVEIIKILTMDNFD